jgi:hypothetical protein
MSDFVYNFFSTLITIWAYELIRWVCNKIGERGRDRGLKTAKEFIREKGEEWPH